MNEVANLPDKEKKEMIDEGKKRTEKYSWGKTAKLTLAVYRSCV
jgi:hypothetical protein